MINNLSIFTINLFLFLSLSVVFCLAESSHDQVKTKYYFCIFIRINMLPCYTIIDLLRKEIHTTLSKTGRRRLGVEKRTPNSASSGSRQAAADRVLLLLLPGAGDFALAVLSSIWPTTLALYIYLV